MASLSHLFPVCPRRTVLCHPIEAFDSELSRFGFLDVVSFGLLGTLHRVVMVERMVPDKLWELF
ncbi:hypothetical protein AB0D86_43125, partial [Streptomyces sp. NPDC048324]|uniref:hypothetical protein n=1 Tax=Streptomyces sp. NPDC048324 TaxID=3157205 RepID=UPI00341DC212